jgi:hypothetical protein
MCFCQKDLWQLNFSSSTISSCTCILGKDHTIWVEEPAFVWCLCVCVWVSVSACLCQRQASSFTYQRQLFNSSSLSVPFSGLPALVNSWNLKLFFSSVLLYSILLYKVNFKKCQIYHNYAIKNINYSGKTLII